ncbi:unnamed protein product [Clonostachys rosea]|uniref:Heterokaryon incompatibility domain-containing protein n=1 Tax=Bionectria ochroleuca TaxID=29856 RepID=A0ABY6UAL6_BIOOC|nr:unnamed protein product [Clonostachys rosea]
MANLSGAMGDIAKGARAAVYSTLWLGRFAKRHYNSAKDGTCLLCNNLKPDGHENTTTWTPEGDSKPTTSLPGGGIIKPPPSGGDILALTLQDLSTAKLLQCRDIDPKTGVPVRDCRYCRLLCEIFDHFFIDEWMSWITETRNGMPVSFGLMIRQGAPLVVTTIGFVHDKYLKNARADIEVYLDSSPPPQTIPALPTIGPAGTRQTDTRSPACMSFIKESVEQCHQEHPLCRNEARGFNPTRLLYLGGKDDCLRLCETAGWEQPLCYAAFSHCWGGSDVVKLTSATLEGFKQQIDVALLPNTFKDAMSVAKELQIPYLWIDSLCIIQGDEADWEIEAARMEQVYSSAFIVITAASSPNPETAILGPREAEWLPKIFELPVTPDAIVRIVARKRHILAAPMEQGQCEPPFANIGTDLKRIGPLYNRGWCFQEAYLAYRNLQFTPGAIVFECKTHRKSEDQLPPYPSTISNAQQSVDLTEQWHRIVKSFTSRQLTYGSDKLPAIGGAARTMPQAQTTQYVAGLWRSTLLFDLMWHVMPYMVLAGQDRQALSFDDHDGGPPTWSWASMNWGVVWTQFLRTQLVAELLDVQVAGSHLDPFGKVSGGLLTLRGRLKRCELRSDGALTHDAFYIKSDGTRSELQHYRTDGPLSFEHEPGPYGARVRRGRNGPYSNNLETTAVVFFIASNTLLASGMWKQYLGLVLGTSPRSPGCLERVGLIWRLPTHWYDTAEEGIVKIA